MIYDPSISEAQNLINALKADYPDLKIPDGEPIFGNIIPNDSLGFNVDILGHDVTNWKVDPTTVNDNIKDKWFMTIDLIFPNGEIFRIKYRPYNISELGYIGFGQGKTIIQDYRSCGVMHIPYGGFPCLRKSFTTDDFEYAEDFKINMVKDDLLQAIKDRIPVLTDDNFNDNWKFDNEFAMPYYISWDVHRSSNRYYYAQRKIGDGLSDIKDDDKLLPDYWLSKGVDNEWYFIFSYNIEGTRIAESSKSSNKNKYAVSSPVKRYDRHIEDYKNPTEAKAYYDKEKKNMSKESNTAIFFTNGCFFAIIKYTGPQYIDKFYKAVEGFTATDQINYHAEDTPYSWNTGNSNKYYYNATTDTSNGN